MTRKIPLIVRLIRFTCLKIALLLALIAGLAKQESRT